MSVVFEMKQREDTRLIPAGWVVAREQFTVNDFPKLQLSSHLKPATVKEDGASIIVSGSNFKAIFDKENGVLTSYKVNGTEYINDGFGPRPFFWRAPTDNDYGARLPKKLNAWKKASYQELQAEDFKINQGDETTISYRYTYPQTNATNTVTYTIYNNGIIRVDNHFDASQCELPYIPRIGMRMQLPNYIVNAEYYGRGQWENYSDRKTSAFVDSYSSRIKDMVTKYVRPQENGHYTDIEWVALTQSSGKGLLFVADETFEFNASNYLLEILSDEEELYLDAPVGTAPRPKHINDYKPSPLVDLFIDYRMQGVGGNNSWGALPLDQYMIKPSSTPVDYGFTIIPIKNKKEINGYFK